MPEAQFKYVCAGCGIDPIPEGEVYPQGKEYYCKRCNKLYHKYLQERAAALAELDRIRAEKTAEVKRRVFGEPVKDVVKAEPKPAVDAEGKAVTPEVMMKIRSILAAEPGDASAVVATLAEEDRPSKKR